MAHVWNDPIDFSSDTDYSKVFLLRNGQGERVCWCLCEDEARALGISLIENANRVKAARDGKIV